MKSIGKNKIYMWLIAILMLANTLTIFIYWGGRIKEMKENSPKEFLVKELKFDDNQKKQFFALAKEHNENAQIIRRKIKQSKDDFFHLLKDPNATDSIEKFAAQKVSKNIEELDLYTFDHFKKVRALCNEEQKEKFDKIISQITSAVSNQIRPSMKPDIDREPADPKH